MPALWLLGFLAYANSFAGAFVLDDTTRVTRHASLTSPLAAMLNSTRPLTDLSFYLNYRLAGPRPEAFHAVNLLLHLAAASLLYGFLRRTFQLPHWRGRYGMVARTLAAAAAALWTVHPLQTESVTYTVQRAECLAGLFLFSTLYAHARSLSSARPSRWQTASIVACALGMASKPVAVVTPLCIALYDWFFRSPNPRQTWRDRSAYYVGLAATWVVLAALLSVPHDSSASSGLGANTPSPLEYAMTQPAVILHYLRLALVPFPLCIDYAWTPALSRREVLVPAAALAFALIAAAVAAARRLPEGFAALWALLCLLPTSSLIPITDCAAEHRMYASLAGWTLLTALLGCRLHRWAAVRGPGALLGKRGTAAAVLLTVLGVLTALTVRRNAVYRSEESLWLNVIATRPDNRRAYINLAKVYIDRREFGKAELLCRAVLERLQRFSSLSSADIPRRAGNWRSLEVFVGARHYAHARNHLGATLAATGRTRAAVEEFREALRLFPSFDMAAANLARAREELARRPGEGGEEGRTGTGPGFSPADT